MSFLQIVIYVFMWFVSVFFVTLLQKRNGNFLEPIDPIDMFAAGSAIAGVILLPYILTKQWTISLLSLTLVYVFARSFSDALWQKLHLSQNKIQTITSKGV